MDVIEGKLDAIAGLLERREAEDTARRLEAERIEALKAEAIRPLRVEDIYAGFEEGVGDDVEGRRFVGRQVEAAKKGVRGLGKSASDAVSTRLEAVKERKKRFESGVRGVLSKTVHRGVEAAEVVLAADAAVVLVGFAHRNYASAVSKLFGIGFQEPLNTGSVGWASSFWSYVWQGVGVLGSGLGSTLGAFFETMNGFVISRPLETVAVLGLMASFLASYYAINDYSLYRARRSILSSRPVREGEVGRMVNWQVCGIPLSLECVELGRRAGAMKGAGKNMLFRTSRAIMVLPKECVLPAGYGGLNESSFEVRRFVALWASGILEEVGFRDWYVGEVILKSVGILGRRETQVIVKLQRCVDLSLFKVTRLMELVDMVKPDQAVLKVGSNWFISDEERQRVMGGLMQSHGELMLESEFYKSGSMPLNVEVNSSGPSGRREDGLAVLTPEVYDDVLRLEVLKHEELSRQSSGDLRLVQFAIPGECFSWYLSESKTLVSAQVPVFFKGNRPTERDILMSCNIFLGVGKDQRNNAQAVGVLAQEKLSILVEVGPIRDFAKQKQSRPYSVLEEAYIESHKSCEVYKELLVNTCRVFGFQADARRNESWEVIRKEFNGIVERKKGLIEGVKPTVVLESTPSGKMREGWF